MEVGEIWNETKRQWQLGLANSESRGVTKDRSGTVSCGFLEWIFGERGVFEAPKRSGQGRLNTSPQFFSGSFHLTHKKSGKFGHKLTGWGEASEEDLRSRSRTWNLAHYINRTILTGKVTGCLATRSWLPRHQMAVQNCLAMPGPKDPKRHAWYFYFHQPCVKLFCVLLFSKVAIDLAPTGQISGFGSLER